MHLVELVCPGQPMHAEAVHPPAIQETFVSDPSTTRGGRRLPGQAGLIPLEFSLAPWSQDRGWL